MMTKDNTFESVRRTKRRSGTANLNSKKRQALTLEQLKNKYLDNDKASA